jgi:hypothetical protein
MHRPHSREIAPVIAAEALLRHGLGDFEVCAYLARTWTLDDVDCDAAVRAAHVLLRREGRDDEPPFM